MNLTLTQLLTSAKASHLPQGMLSAFTDLESQKDVGKNKMDGSAEKALEPALRTLSDPAAITLFAYLRPESSVNLAIYSPSDFQHLPTVSMVSRGEDLELKYPAPIADLVFAFMEGLLPYAEDDVKLDIALPIDQARVVWAMLDWIRYHKDEPTLPVSLESLTELTALPMMSLFSLAAYFRDALDLTQATKPNIKKACSALLETNILKQTKGGYMPGGQIRQLGMHMASYRSHLRLTNKVLKDGSVFEMKYWCIQGENGLCLLWYEVDGLVQLMTLPIDRLIQLIEHLIFQSEESYA